MKQRSIFFLLLFPLCLFGQQSFKELISKNGSRDYNEIVEAAETYFTQKQSVLNRNQLAYGEFRDGEYVKYMRWQSFWKNRLTPNGKLADLSNFNRLQAKGDTPERQAGQFDNVSWENISYSTDLGVQIGIGRTNAVAFHPSNPNIFYVAAAIGGIWRTTDGGQSYTPLGDELPFLAVSAIVVDQNNPNTLYIAISDRVWYGPGGIGIYKSVNGGLTWSPTALSFDFAQQIKIYWMEADPDDSNKMFVGTDEGLYLTTDGFASVNQVATGGITDVKFKPGDSNVVYCVDAVSGQFFKSSNGGTSFNMIRDFGNTHYTRIATSHLNPNKVYVSHNNILYKSNDSGENFPSFSYLSGINIAGGIVVFSPANENHIYAGNFDMHRSTSDGDTFNQISHWLGNSNLPLIHVDQRNAFVNPLQNDRIYICNDGGLYTVNVNTNEFANLSNGMVITQYFDIATAQSHPIVMSGGSQDNGNVFREASTAWTMAAPTADGMMQAINPVNENIRYNAIQNGAIFRFIDGMRTNISSNIPNDAAGTGEWQTPFLLDPNNPSRIIAGYDRVYSSSNQGDTWQDISGVLANGNNIDLLAVAPSNSNRVYAVENFGTGTGAMFGFAQTSSVLYVKNNNNNNWTNKTLPATENVQEIAVDFTSPNTIYIVAAGFIAGHKVFKSTDAGDTWENISGTLPNVPATAIELYEDIPGAIFIGTDEGLFYRDDTMTDWEEYGEFPNTYITDIEIQQANKLLRVGTHGRGILQAPLPDNECLTNNPPDSDSDGVCDAYDVCPGGDDNEDLDGDGLPDFCEMYCTAAGTDGTTSDWIDFAGINTIENWSQKSAYTDFTNLTTDLIKGQNYTLIVGLNYTFPLDQAFAWIDYNQNNTFEANEEITVPAYDNNGHAFAPVNVPVNAMNGPTRLRLRNVYSATGLPCGSQAGEVEDYTVNIVDCVGNSCDDGLASTTDDVYDENCICAGTAFPEVAINIKTVLQGPYDPNFDLMKDDLRQKGMIPSTEPYSADANFQHNGSEQILGGVVTVTGVNAIVDWVLVELRSSDDASEILASKAGLIQRDGDVVDVDGISPLEFVLPSEEYYIAVRHRNHLGVMTATPLLLQAGLSIDFSNINTLTYGQDAMFALSSNKKAMWSGNSNSNVEVIFQGGNNDTNEVFFDVLTATENTGTQINFIHDGYFPADVNLDGQVIYQGLNNEPNVIFFNVLLHPSNPTGVMNYIISEQLP